jgi:hypothetical protein
MISGKKQQPRMKPRGKPWPPGISGNPAGRPRGALNKLSLAVKGQPLVVFSPIAPIKYDARRSHEHGVIKIDGQWRRVVMQDGQTFDRDTGALLSGM